MRSAATLSAVLAALTLAGCGGDDESTTVTVRETVTETATASGPTESSTIVALYFLQDGQVWPEARGITTDQAIATNTIHQLFEGTESDLTTAIPPETRLGGLTVDGGVASIQLEPPLKDRKAMAQVAYTLLQFPTVRRVSFNGGRPLGAGAFEPQTPAILVQDPLGGEEVEPGFEATGTANTFEATFQYELLDAGGKVLKKEFVTATSGSGTRGTFSFTVPYEVSSPQQGRLVVFEISAENGSRTKERTVPLTLR